MSNEVEFITIIRPSFMRFCKDACRAAAFNHILFRIAGKCKDQPKEKIQSGDITWYASNELITEEMSHAWGVCKVRKEINELLTMGLFDRRNNPQWGADRTKHFAFGTEQCQKFLDYCEECSICVVHLGLSPEVTHLIYSSNANDKSIKCICSIHQMETMDISNANDKSIEAITIDSITIDSIKEDESNAQNASAFAPHTAAPEKQKKEADNQQEPSPKRTRKPKPKAPVPSGPPMPPLSETPWGTRKCLAWFDYWRGAYLIGTYKNSQAATCAKGLAEQYSEETVLSIREDMLADPYWIAQGGCDVCNVANNITKYLRLREAKKRGVIAPASTQTTAKPTRTISSFDDPDYTCEDEFYPSEYERQQQFARDREMARAKEVQHV